jgi:hypothetical protein
MCLKAGAMLVQQRERLRLSGVGGRRCVMVEQSAVAGLAERERGPRVELARARATLLSRQRERARTLTTALPAPLLPYPLPRRRVPSPRRMP